MKLEREGEAEMAYIRTSGQLCSTPLSGHLQSWRPYVRLIIGGLGKILVSTLLAARLNYVLSQYGWPLGRRMLCRGQGIVFVARAQARSKARWPKVLPRAIGLGSTHMSYVGALHESMCVCERESEWVSEWE